MRVDLYMDKENKFEVNRWWANSPEFVIDTLTRQLDAAGAIWPELHGFKIVAEPPTISINKA